MKNVFFLVLTKAPKSLLLGALTFALISCNGSGGGSSSAKKAAETIPPAAPVIDQSKIFAQYFELENQFIDFTMCEFNTPCTNAAIIDWGETCQGTAVIKEDGTVVLSSFTGTAPACADLNGNYTFKVVDCQHTFTQTVFVCGTQDYPYDLVIE